MPWVVLGIVAVALIVAAPRLLEAVKGVSDDLRVKETRDACAALRSALEALPQGTDPNTRSTLEAQLRACENQLEALAGEGSVDRVSGTLVSCRSTIEQMRREWSHFLSTEWADPVKRNNTRNAILRFGQDVLSCLEGARGLATTVRELKEVRKVARDLQRDAVERYNAFVSGAAGTGRFGWIEPHHHDKARAEDDRIIKPAVAFIKSIDAQIADLEAVEKAAREAAEKARKDAEQARRRAEAERFWAENSINVISSIGRAGGLFFLPKSEGEED